MDEVRRFVRYVIPGMVLMFEVGIFLLIHDGASIGQSLAGLSGKGSSVWLAVSLLLGSGGIGFVMASAYHVLYWSKPYDYAIDHRSIFRDGLPGFRAVDIGGSPLPSIDKREAWTLVTQYCQSERKKPGNVDIDSMCVAIDRFVDVTHGLGTALLSTFFSAPAWLLVRQLVVDASAEVPFWRGIAVAVIWFLLMSVFWHGQRGTQLALERIVNGTLLGRLHRNPGGFVDVFLIRGSTDASRCEETSRDLTHNSQQAVPTSLPPTTGCRSEAESEAGLREAGA